MLTKEIKGSIKESVLCWLATADKSGAPNCSPKEVFTYRGKSELIIANIASPESVKNIQENPNVCVSFVHVFKQKGYKLKGTAEYVSSEKSGYPELFGSIQAMVGNTFPVKGIILVKVSSVASIVAPGYYLIPGATETSQIASAKRTYGV